MSKYTAVGAYIFAGNFTLGVKRVFNVLAHLEENDYGVATVRHNMPRLPVYYPPETWPLRQLRRDGVDFVYANPPCAPFSAMGRHQWRNDARLQCIANVVGLTKTLRPKVLAWESVTRAFTTARELVDRHAAEVMDQGYSVTFLLIDGQYLGMPQRRRRFFFVAHKVAFDVPDPDFESVITAGQALKGLRPRYHTKKARTVNRFQPLMRYVVPGSSMRTAWDRWRKATGHRIKRNKHGQVIGRPNFGAITSTPDRPSSVVTGNFIAHWDGRPMAINELKRLCGVPDDYEYVGHDPARQLARAVMPPIGEWLARNVKRAFDADERLRKPRVRVINISRPNHVRREDIEL
jgi:site-specific DNA-cytosine methylase